MVEALRGIVEEPLVAGGVGLHKDGGHVVALHFRARDHFVCNRNILGMVLIVVNLKGLLPNVRLKSCVVVGKIREAHGVQKDAGGAGSARDKGRHNT